MGRVWLLVFLAALCSITEALPGRHHEGASLMIQWASHTWQSPARTTGSSSPVWRCSYTPACSTHWSPLPGPASKHLIGTIQCFSPLIITLPRFPPSSDNSEAVPSVYTEAADLDLVQFHGELTTESCRSLPLSLVLSQPQEVSELTLLSLVLCLNR